MPASTLPPPPPAGLRMAKLAAVGVYLLSILLAALTWWSAPAQAELLTVLDRVSWIFRFVTVPALLTAAALGVAMFTRAPGAYLRARWWQAKALLLIVGVPAGHYGVAGSLRALRQSLEGAEGDPALLGTRLAWALGLLLAGSLGVVALAILRPGWDER